MVKALRELASGVLIGLACSLYLAIVATVSWGVIQMGNFLLK